MGAGLDGVVPEQVTPATPSSRRADRSMWPLISPYWVSEDRFRAWGLFLAITALTLATVWVNVRLNSWSGDFYNALQDKKFETFQRLLLEFAGWAFAYIALVVYAQYLTQMLQMRWRRWMTDVYLVRWMEASAFYRIGLVDLGSDNPDQRIAEDLRDFIFSSLDLFFGLLKAVASFVAFVGILWALSGPLEVGGVVIPGYMVWVALAYALVGSLLTHAIGKPLIRLNFLKERYEADFRYALLRVRENAEGVALYRGEAGELANFRQRFGHLIGNWWAIMKSQRRLNWFSSFYGQLAVVFPILVAAPRYFSGALQLGGLVQISNAFGEVQDALSWFVDAYARIAAWRASIHRLRGFMSAIDRAQALGEGMRRDPADRIGLGDVAVHLPQAPEAGSGLMGRLLVQADAEQIAPLEHTLIEGSSGSGKSLLFRTLAGIWPFAQGQMSFPAPDQVLFLPQKPYLPLGNLRSVVCYPGALQPDERIAQALHAVELPALAQRLDEEASWAQILSGGEQQRLALARALLVRPRWLFLDEATSAVDEAMELRLYGLLRQDLPQTTLISIAHRPQVARFHRQRLILETDRDGAPSQLRRETIPSSEPA